MINLDNKPTKKIAKLVGLRSKSSDIEIGFDGLSEAKNIDITRNNKAKRRKGHTQVRAGSFDAAYADRNRMLLTSGTELYALNVDMTLNTLRTDLTPSNELNAYTLGDSIYYSNGYETGVLLPGGSNRGLGLSRPAPVALSSTFGKLPAGRYQSTITYIRNDGQESGANLAVVIDLTAEYNGIVFTLPVSPDSSVEFVRIYLSNTNGSELYQAGEVQNGVTSYSYQEDTRHLHIPLKTSFYSKPPAFNLIDFHGPRMLYVVGSVIFYSLPFSYELIDLKANYVPFNSKITVIAVLKDGIYVGTETEIFFLAGRDIAESKLERVADYGAVSGSRVYGDGSIIGDGQTREPLPIWTSKQGIVVGLPGGELINVTQRQADITEGVKATALFRQEDGQNHYVNVIQS